MTNICLPRMLDIISAFVCKIKKKRKKEKSVSTTPIVIYSIDTHPILTPLSLPLFHSLRPAWGLGVREDADGEGQQPRRDPESS